jgi:UDP:flavonoid glycosyltransferase YjiC (YdhE family)
MKRLLFSGDGSSGDLLPMVLMAREFKLAGYEVVVCGAREFSKIASDFEVPFEPYTHSYGEVYLDQQKPGYIHNIRENIKHQQAVYQGEFDVLSKIGRDYDVIFNLLHELFVPSIAEAFGKPNIKMATFPVLRCDLYGAAAGLPFITRNKYWNRMTWHAAVFSADRLFHYNATIDRLRGELGLPPIPDLLTNNSRCDHLMLGAYEELMPPCPSWNFPYKYIGPCLPRTKVALSESLEAFLGRGEKPIYIGFGSMKHANANALTRLLVDAVRQAGVRAVIAQAANSDLGAELDDMDDIYVLKEYPIPHHVLFPRLAAAIHHGSGITMHLAAQAGIPQLVMAQASDQYIWGDAVWRAGVAPKMIDMNWLKPKRLIQRVAELVSREDLKVNAKALGDRRRDIDGAKNAVLEFERIKDRLAGNRVSVPVG